MNNKILKAEHLHKSYKMNKKVRLDVLTDVSLEIEANKISVIVGASGAGKSTLLHLLGTLDRPDSGKIIYKDENIFSLSDDRLANFRNKNIGFIFQFHHLLPEFTALENISIPQMISGISLSDAAKKSRKLLNTVGLSERMGHKPAELSGGERQRVAVARALINQPTMLLCDEPTGNLDHANANAIADLLFELHREEQNILIVVTHSLELAGRFPKRLKLIEGKIKEE
ncbi:MAG: ABC transporter ATP-binding protein [Bacteroidetes bacterium]|nr:ABC transporter ATP-binding protein [Bacteroidota bacterium]